MTGLIWFVQIVHYPSFLNFSSDRNAFGTFHAHHVFRTGVVVIPVMLAELGTSISLNLLSTPVPIINITGLGLVILIWLSTFLLQAPAHNKLQNGFNEKVIQGLLNTNWIRTILWSTKALLSLAGYCYL
jgi:hypothetical protein